MEPADPASDWLRDRLSDGKCLKIAILSFSTGKIVAVLLFYSSFYGLDLQCGPLEAPFPHPCCNNETEEDAENISHERASERPLKYGLVTRFSFASKCLSDWAPIQSKYLATEFAVKNPTESLICKALQIS